MNSRRSLKGLVPLMFLAFLFSGCISIDEVIQPLIAKAGETITITVHVEIRQTKTNNAERIIFGFLAPRHWNVAKNSKITYSSNRGDGKMTLVPPGVLATGFDREWPATLLSRFKIGPNLVRDMEWVTFQTDSTYASVDGGPVVKGLIKIITKVGMENEIVKPGYFVTTGEGIDPSDNPVYGNDLHIDGGKGQLFDFSHPQVATIVPVRSVDNDYITMTFDGNARSTPLTVSTAVFLQAIGYTKDQQLIKVTEMNAGTRLAPMGDNKWRIQIRPRTFFNLKDGQSLSRMEYYFTNKAGDKVGYDRSDTPFIYEYSR
jgi:hypothetical protein